MSTESAKPDPYAEPRRRMVERQLAARDITDSRVLAAMLRVPREEFVPPALRDTAYDDCPLPIGQGQTISQPFTVAFMAQSLMLTGSERVLEIGTGCGYGAAILSKLAREVISIERLEYLGASAAARLARLGYGNVEVVIADGTLGCPSRAPFDAIVVTAGAGSLPTAYRDQLGDGGQCVIPIGATRHEQHLLRFTRRGDRLFEEDLGAFAFVPLIGEQGWAE